MNRLCCGDVMIRDGDEDKNDVYSISTHIT